MESNCCLSVAINEYNLAFPNYAEPKIIGEYSVTKSRDVIIGRKFMRYLNESLVNQRHCSYDLCKGYDTFEKKDELNNEKLDVLLHWISMTASPNASLRQVCSNADIVCWRGLLTKIAAFPYEKRDGFRLVAVNFRSVIFLCEFYTDEKIRQLQSATDRQQLMAYWGFKDVNEPINNLEQFSVVFQTSLGGSSKIRILSSAEVDCVNSKNEYIEIKTQCRSFNDGFWRLKAIKWWIQSFLVGIAEIIVGFRDNTGKVFETRSLQVSKLIHKKSSWSPNVAFNFLQATLTLIKQQLDASQELEYYLMDFVPGRQKLRLRRLPAELPFDFIPETFIKQFENL